MSQFKVTATALNVRQLPSAIATILGSLNQNDVVTALETSQDQKWLKIDNGSGLIGWSSYKYLIAVVPPAAATNLDDLLALANGSAIATFDWTGRGVAPRGYVKGMAVAFARVYAKLKAGDAAALDMAKADTGSASTDALAHYAAKFDALGLSNDSSGPSTLRHLFVLLMGLGMRESSGRYCEGRDRSASNTSANTAEAGLFQTSYDIRTQSQLLGSLFAHYRANPAGFKDVFKQGVTATTNDLEIFGAGDGAAFQKLSKDSPAFAVEFAAVGLRHNRKHWGPINTRAAQLRPEADKLFLRVQNLVDSQNLDALVL